MIQFIDEAIEALLRRDVPLPEGSADVSFAAPDRQWGAGVTRPTVNVFLWDIRRNTTRMTAGLAQQSSDGAAVARRPSNPVVDLRYLVTAWAAEHRDEHQLLGSVLRCVLANSKVPMGDLPPQLPATSLSLSLASEAAGAPGEFWRSLDGRLKPGLQIVVSLPLDVFAWVETAPQATAVSLATRDLADIVPAVPQGRLTAPAPAPDWLAPTGSLCVGAAVPGCSPWREGQSLPALTAPETTPPRTQRGRTPDRCAPSWSTRR